MGRKGLGISGVVEEEADSDAGWGKPGGVMRPGCVSRFQNRLKRPSAFCRATRRVAIVVKLERRKVPSSVSPFQPKDTSIATSPQLPL